MWFAAESQPKANRKQKNLIVVLDIAKIIGTRKGHSKLTNKCS